jgi:hypothetical protein
VNSHTLVARQQVFLPALLPGFVSPVTASNGVI